MLQFKWQDPEETGGRPITCYQALALRPSSGSDLDPAAVGFFNASHTCMLPISVSMQEWFDNVRQRFLTPATAPDDCVLGICRGGNCCAMALTTATS